jgi:hemoglobin
VAKSVSRNAVLFSFAFCGAGLLWSPAHSSDSLYDDLGQKAGLDRIAASLVARVHEDARTKDYFEGVSDKRLTEKLSEQFCELAEGPCTYTGHTMKQAHAGLHITRAAFNALVEDLQAAMDENKVSYAAQNRLLAKLAPMSHDIVETP